LIVLFTLEVDMGCTQRCSTLDWVEPGKLGAPVMGLSYLGRVGLVDTGEGVVVLVGSCTLPGGMSQGC
jgi:hypothetical protein